MQSTAHNCASLRGEGEGIKGGEEGEEEREGGGGTAGGGLFEQVAGAMAKGSSWKDPGPLAWQDLSELLLVNHNRSNKLIRAENRQEFEWKTHVRLWR